NSIPANMIERIEVLSDGASSVYGSDAIGGVVNFILKDHYQGVQLSSDYGESSHGDGNRRNFSVLAGLSGDRYNLIVGATQQSTNGITAAARSYSQNALALNNGQVVKLGSSTVPTGLVEDASGTYVTLNPDVSGITTLSDYHTFGPADSYNYQPYNLIETPQKRTNLSLVGDFKITPDVDAYTNLFYTRTASAPIETPARAPTTSTRDCPRWATATLPTRPTTCSSPPACVAASAKAAGSGTPTSTTAGSSRRPRTTVSSTTPPCSRDWGRRSWTAAPAW